MSDRAVASESEREQTQVNQYYLPKRRIERTIEIQRIKEETSWLSRLNS